MPKASKNRKGRLVGKIALITGASQGIGFAIAQALAHEGCNLILTGRTSATLEKARKALARQSIRVLAQTCDVRDPKSVKSLAAAIKEQFSRVDILINNAGIGHRTRTVSKLPLEDWKKVIDTNLTGTFLVTHELLPLMQRGATIVNNLSITAKRVFTGSSAYNASKHGALGLTNTLREELRLEGIRVIALVPGATDTEIWNSLWPDAPRQKMMTTATVAQALLSALLLPEDSTVEELTIMPTAGTL